MLIGDFQCLCETLLGNYLQQKRDFIAWESDALMLIPDPKAATATSEISIDRIKGRVISI